jgi:tetratricopeptide (TPR) repeat protein
MTKPTAKAAKGAKRNNRPGRELLAATAQIVSPILLSLLLGCSTAQPLPPVPVAVSQAERTAEQAAKLSESQNWPAAAQEWKLAAERFGLLNDQAREAVALHNLAQAQRELGQAVPAWRLLEEAASLNEKIGRTNEWWRNQIALLQLEALSADAAALRARFEKLAPVAEHLADHSVRALFLNELGLWRQTQGDFTNAAACYREAARLFARSADPAGHAAVTANLARFFEARKNPEEALKFWRLALGEFERLADPHGIACALAGQGRSQLAAQKDLPAAEELLRRAARNYRLLQCASETRTTLELLGNCLVAEGKNGEALSVQAELRDLAGRSGPLPAR